MVEAATVCRIDDLTVDFARRKVFDGNRAEIPLSALSFDTLRVLVEAAPAAVTTDELIERAWRGSVVSDETVTQRIRLLRKALGDDRRRPRYIETVRTVGYRLVPPVTEIPCQEGLSRHCRDPGSPSIPTGPKMLPPMLVAGALVAVVLGASSWLSWTGPDPASSENSASVLPRGAVTATELVEQAKHLVRQRNEASLRHAIRLYEQALRMEPDDAGIRTGLSMALSTAVAWYGDPLSIAVRAEQLARSARSNDVSFGAEFALAFSLDAQGKTEPARSAYERAVALDPTHWGARSSLAYLLQEEGKLVEALSHDMIAFERAPPGILDTQVAACLRLLGFREPASEWLQRADRLYPDSAHAAPARALDLITRNEFERARTVIDGALARGVVQVELYEYLVILALLHGDTESAAAIIDSVPDSISHRGIVGTWRSIVDAMANGTADAAIALGESLRADIAAGDTWPGNFLYVAMLEAVAGREDHALMALDRLDTAGYRDYLWLQLLPPFESLHDEPRFRAIIDSMRGDVARQRAQVLTADWLPQELRVARLDPVTR